MMQWLPLHLVGPEDSRAIIKTFQSVFPYTSVWNSYLTRIVLLVGSDEPQVLDQDRFDELMKNKELQKMAEQIGIFNFVDMMDFYLTDGKLLAPLIEDTSIITDDYPLLEHSPATLVPPLKRETDESFLNLLRFRIGLSPPLKGGGTQSMMYLKRNYEMRTAQRISIFSQRYRGPGAEAFARKNYRAGLAKVQTYLEGHEGPFIQLSDSGWE